MNIHDVYGVVVNDRIAKRRNLEEAAQVMRSILNADFDEHESLNWNGTYFVHKSEPLGTVRILDNVADDPEDAPYPEFSQYAVIVSVESPKDADTILLELTEGIGLVHLRRQRRNYGRPADRSLRDPSVISGAFDLYGLKPHTLSTGNDARAAVTFLMNLLRVEFAGNESAFFGRDNYYYDESERYGEIRVMNNVPDKSGYTRFEEYADYSVIVSFYEAPHPEELRETLTSRGFTYLERSIFPAPQS